MANLRKLRDYQNKINVEVIKFLQDPTFQRGQVYSPTGSGKTECFGHTVHDLPSIIKNFPKYNVAIVHPRIALSQEQLKRFKDMFGPKYRYTSFHSGSHVKGAEADLEINTTDPNKLLKIMIQEQRSHIVFSSYDSFDKIADIAFDLVIFDEGHNLTQPSYRSILENLKARKALFYTATPIVKELEEDMGMADLQLFGDVIVRVEPKTLFPRGYIVPPIVHILRVKTDGRGEDVDTVSIVAETFLHQQQEMAKYNMPYTQMLVASRGREDINLINEGLSTLWEKIGSNVPVYTVLAGEVKKNGKIHLQNNRMAVLDEIKQSNESCILVHYDTLAEGIDINSLTGACILRNMSKAKLLQTIGRCGRPLASDLNSDGEIEDMNSRLKRCSVVTLPIVDGKHIGGLESKKIVDAFVEGGYAELTTYLDDETKKTMSDKKDEWDFGGSDKDDILAGIVGSTLERDIKLVLEELGIIM